MPIQQVEMFQRIRRRILQSVEGITRDELLWVPPGFRNNILWNLGHILVVQQTFHYRYSGQPLRVPDHLVGLFEPGSSPAEWTRPPDVDHLLELLAETPHTLAVDYEEGRLSDYQPYTTKSGMRIENIDHALTFNEFHEGLHTGVIECMRRLWRGRGEGHPA
jgi:hypothetical protein